MTPSTAPFIGIDSDRHSYDIAERRLAVYYADEPTT